MANNRGSDVKIDDYHGLRTENFDHWLLQFEIVFDSNNWPEARKHKTLAAHMKGKAFLEYISLPRDVRDDYSQLVGALKTKFCSTDHKRVAHQAFEARKQRSDEDVREYGLDLGNLALHAFADFNAKSRDDIVREHFLMGLKWKIGKQVIAANPQTFEEAQMIAERIETLEKQDQPDLVANIDKMLSDKLAALNLHESRDGATSRTSSHGVNHRGKSHRTEQNSRTPSPARQRCEICWRTNHCTDEHVSRRARKSSYRAANHRGAASQDDYYSHSSGDDEGAQTDDHHTVICDYCVEPGHTEKDCDMKRRADQRRALIHDAGIGRQDEQTTGVVHPDIDPEGGPSQWMRCNALPQYCPASSRLPARAKLFSSIEEQIEQTIGESDEHTSQLDHDRAKSEKQEMSKDQRHPEPHQHKSLVTGATVREQLDAGETSRAQISAGPTSCIPESAGQTSRAQLSAGATSQIEVSAGTAIRPAQTPAGSASNKAQFSTTHPNEARVRHNPRKPGFKIRQVWKTTKARKTRPVKLPMRNPAEDPRDGQPGKKKSPRSNRATIPEIRILTEVHQDRQGTPAFAIDPIERATPLTPTDGNQDQPASLSLAMETIERATPSKTPVYERSLMTIDSVETIATYPVVRAIPATVDEEPTTTLHESGADEPMTQSSNQQSLAYHSKTPERKTRNASRTLSKAEKNYAAVQKEALAVTWSLKLFRYCLYGRHTTVYTDHKPLVWLFQTKILEGRIAKWVLEFQDYDFEVKYRKGKDNANADALSRVTTGNTVGATTVNLEHPMTTESLVDEQQKDGWIRTICKNLRKRRLGSDPVYVMKKGVLLRKAGTKRQIVVPEHWRNTVLHSAHDEHLSGHMGIRRTYERVVKTYYWRSCYQDTVEYCQTCVKCQRRSNPQTTHRAPMVSMPVRQVFQRIAIDIVGPLKKTVRGNTHILTVMEYVTKWPEAIPLPDTKSETIARALVSLIFRFGIPTEILSDRGANLIGEVMHVSRLLRINRKLTTAYHPQTNGMLERFHKTIESVISKMDDPQSNWDLHLPPALYAYRTSKHESTGDTPFYLMYGRDSQNLGALPDPADVTPGTPIKSTEEYRYQLTKALTKARQKAIENIESAQLKQKEGYDSQTKKTACFLAGDLVYLHNPAVPVGNTPKFHSHWRGIFRVLHVTPDGTVATLKSLVDQQAQVIRAHTNRLKLAKVRATSPSEDDKDLSTDGPQDEPPHTEATPSKKPAEIPTYVVWAKITGYPEWPGLTIPSDQIPEQLAAQPHTDMDAPIRFFGDDAVAWIPKDRISDFAANYDRFKDAKQTRRFKKAVEEARKYSQELVT